MSQPTEKSDENNKTKFKPSVTLLIILIAVFFLGNKVVRDPIAAWQFFFNVAIVVLGFGAVIFVHELGHFVAAKSVGILVEGFSLGFGPIVISFKRVRQGLRMRILPSLLPGRDGEGALRVIIPLSGQKEGDTEYRLNLIPLGGFVKMLGQEDVAADKPSDDPRAFPNKAVWKRAVVISAGVIMNVICGAIVFMIVFARGYAMPPAVVGDLAPLKPAAQAGIRSGDVITAVNGKEPFGFMDVFIAAAFSDENEKVKLTVTHPDQTVETLAIAPEKNDSLGIKAFGFGKPYTLTIAQVKETDFLEKMKRLGVMPGDKIVAVNGEPISEYYQLSEIIYPLPGVNPGEIVTLTVERKDRSGEISRHPVEIPMKLTLVETHQTTYDTIITHIMGMVPRLQMAAISPDGPGAAAGLEPNDVILRIGAVDNPTLKELKDYCKKHVDQAVELLVQRTENGRTVEKLIEVTPRREKQSFWQRLWNKPNVVIGFYPRLDLDSTIVAAVHRDIVNKYPELSSLPRGAEITAVADEPVENWRQIIDRLAQYQKSAVPITYRAASDQPEKTITLNMTDKFVWAGYAYRPDFGPLIDLPLEPHTELFKGKNWLENLQMGVNQSYSFLAQTYLFIRGMIKGTVSPAAASGPVGILKMSYTIAETRDSNSFLYFMALISVCVAAFNFLPIPVLDGGHFLMLIIEKIKGSPVSMRVQEIASYAGLMLIVGLVVAITFSDIINIITGKI